MAYAPVVTVPANGSFLNPNIVSGQANTQSFNSTYDAYVINEWYMRKTRNNQQLNWCEYLMATGAVRGNNSPTTGHYEAGKLTDNLFIGAVITGANPGNNGQVIVELSAASMLNGNLSYPQPYMLGLTQANNIQFWIVSKNTAVNPHRLTLQPTLSTQNIFPELAAGQKIFLTHGTGVEGSPFRQPTQRRFSRYTNTFVPVITAPKGTTDIEATNVYRYVVEGQPENSATWVIENLDLEKQHAFEVSNALIYGQTSNTVTETIATLGQTFTSTGSQGLISFMEDYAFLQDYNNVSYFTLEKMANTFAKEQTTAMAFDAWNGIDFQQAAQSALADYGRELRTTELPILTWNPEDDARYTQAGLFLKAGAYGFDMNGYDFRFHVLPNLSDSTQGGTEGYGFSWYSMVLPRALFKNQSNGSEYPSAMLEYKQSATHKYFFHNRQYDGIGLNGNNLVGNTDAVSLNEMRSQVCLHLSCGNNMILLKNLNF